MTDRLELSHAVIKYGDVKAVDDVSLSVKAGEFVFITGANGSGKSTLTRGIAGLLPLSSGTMTRTSRLGYVPQVEDADRNFPASVWEIVITGTQGTGGLFYSMNSRRRALMDELNIRDLAKREIRTLSGGQMRRVLLARALCGEPELLLLDEPCAGLDVESHALLFSVLRKSVASGCAVIMVTHDASDLEGIHADRVITLSHGRIVNHD